MKYMMLINHGDAPTPHTPDAWAALSETEQQAIFAGWKALNETPGVTPGVALKPPALATTIRVEAGKTLVTDGPFAAVKEAVGGWFLFEGDDLDAAIAVAASVPSASRGGSVEIRPIHEW